MSKSSQANHLPPPTQDATQPKVLTPGSNTSQDDAVVDGATALRRENAQYFGANAAKKNLQHQSLPPTPSSSPHGISSKNIGGRDSRGDSYNC